MRESEKNYKLLFENTGSAINFFDPEGKVILMNEDALDRLGWETEDLAGKSIYDILPKKIADFNIRVPCGRIERWTSPPCQSAMPYCRTRQNIAHAGK